MDNELNMSGSDLLDAIFNMYKVRFNKLDDIMWSKEIPIPYGHCNVFLNLEPVLVRLCNKRVDEYLKTIDADRNIRIISNIINLVAHYRLYFSKNGIGSKVFLYYQQPNNTHQHNQTIIPCYRKNYLDRFCSSTNFHLMDTIVGSYDLIKLILEYVDGVYMIDPSNMESSLVPLVISNHYNDSKVTNFIISNNVYDYQYVNYGFNVIYPKKEESDIITKKDMMNFLSNKHGADFSALSSKLLPFIISIVGENVLRNIYGVKGMGVVKTIKMLNKALESGLISEDVTNINLLIQMIKEDYRGTIRKNFQCIDIATQYESLSPGGIYQITNQLIDKFDNESLKEINDQYFAFHPLQLLELSSRPKSKNNVQF